MNSCLPSGDIGVKSAAPKAACMPSALSSGIRDFCHSSFIFGRYKSTDEEWKADVNVFQLSTVSDAATASTLEPSFGSTTVIVNTESPYGRSTAWYVAVSA